MRNHAKILSCALVMVAFAAGPGYAQVQTPADGSEATPPPTESSPTAPPSGGAIVPGEAGPSPDGKKGGKKEGYRPFTPEAFQKDPQKGDPGLLGQPFPKTPEEASKTLGVLLAELAKTDDYWLGLQISATVEKLWRLPGGDTVNLLVDRADMALQKNESEKAIKFLDAAVDLAPDYAEAWNKRAFAHARLGHTDAALGDWRRVLALEPNHFRALEGMGKHLLEAGEKKGALKALEQLLKVFPRMEGLKTAVEDLRKAVEGQGI